MIGLTFPREQSLLTWFFLREASIHAIFTFSAHDIRKIVFRQIFGPCATAGGLETFPTRGRCRGGFLRCGAARHGGSWGAPLPLAWPPICKLAMAGQHHQQWLKEKVPGGRGCVISHRFFAIFHYLRGLFQQDMGNSNCFYLIFEVWIDQPKWCVTCCSGNLGASNSGKWVGLGWKFPSSKDPGIHLQGDRWTPESRGAGTTAPCGSAIGCTTSFRGGGGHGKKKLQKTYSQKLKKHQ